jgi:hypothetical protein
MNTIFHDTGDAVFHFQANDVIEHLKDPLNDYDDEATARLLRMICTDSEESIEIPEEQELFGYVALSLLEQAKGAVTCKACNRIYEADQLKSVELGAGNSPFHVTIKPERGIRNLFRRGKRRNPSMVGGQAFECPEGHTLISMITWRT